MIEAAIKVREISKVFGGNAKEALRMISEDASKEAVQRKTGAVLALADVSFDVYEGEIFVIMGLSGCGKSTLIRCLNLLLRPNAGSVKIYGEEITSATAKQLRELRRNTVSMVFQHYGLLPHRDVSGNVKWALEVRGEDEKTQENLTKNAIETVGLSGRENAYPRELSGGMQQRVGIARVLAQDTRVMLMDEPFSGLDPLIRREMQDELTRIQADIQKTIVFITHDPNEAMKLGDRVAIMKDGRIVQIGTPQEVVMEPANNYVGEFTRDVHSEEIVTVQEVMVDPTAVVHTGASLDTALRQMRRCDSPVVLVIGEGRKYEGSLSLEQALKGVRRKVATTGECYIDNSDTVQPDSLLKDMIPLLMSIKHLMPVVDDEGKLVGELHCSAIANFLAADTSVFSFDDNEMQPVLGYLEKQAIREAVSLAK